MPNSQKNKKRQSEQSQSRSMKRRSYIALALFVVFGFGLLIARLYILQIRDFEKYRGEASKQQLKDVVLQPERGQILDANGKVLAKSTIVWDITADPSQIRVKPEKGETPEVTATRLMQKIQAASGELAELLDLEYEEVYGKLSQTKSQYVVLKKKVEKPLADQVTALADELDLPVSAVQNTRREYPYGAFAASVLGFCNAEGEGFYGLEQYYQDELAGVPGRMITLRNGLGRQMSDEDAEVYDVKHGDTLTLTLDANIQSTAEKYLETAIRTRNVQDRGLAMVMDVNTGAILAMAVKPDFDPNDPYEIYDEGYAAQLEAVSDPEEYTKLQGQLRELQWKNKAITDLYYPGSVFKIITAASSLDAGVCTPNSWFSCEPGFNVVGQPFSCAEGAVHHGQDMALALRNSCNRYFIQVGQQLGPQRFFDYFNAFGFTEPTGVDLPSEQRYTSYYNVDGLRPVELATVSFGQGNKITPLQMITAASAVVNGGYLVQPHIVSSITDANGNLVKEMQPVVKRQVISETVSAQVANMMRGIVDNGKRDAPGRNAYVAGYDIGGKSGTSEKLDVPRTPDGQLEVVSSFLAVLPVDDPQIAVLVVLDDPRYGRNFGSQLAAPVVGNIISEVAPYLGLATDPTQAVSQTVRVPNLLGKGDDSSWAMAQVELNKAGLKHRVIGSGETVRWQFPYEGEKVPAGITVYLYTDSTKDTLVSVPDVMNQTGEQAAQMLQSASLNVQVVGPPNGTVTGQSEAVDAQVPMGTIVTINTADETVPE